MHRTLRLQKESDFSKHHSKQMDHGNQVHFNLLNKHIEYERKKTYLSQIQIFKKKLRYMSSSENQPSKIMFTTRITAVIKKKAQEQKNYTSRM